MKPGELKSGIITYPTPTEMGAETEDGIKVWSRVETLKMKPGELCHVPACPETIKERKPW